MNEICKERIRERLVDALKKENLTNAEAVTKLGVTKTSISCTKNPALWYNVSAGAWEKLQKWCNSGDGIVVWGNKHRVESLASKRFAEEVVKADADITARMQSTIFPEIVPEAVIPDDQKKISLAIQAGTGDPFYAKSVSESIKAVQKEKPQPRIENGDFMEMLREERARLISLVDAIDILLNHYS